MKENESIHPDVKAKMEMWDGITGRSSRRVSAGPLAPEIRARIGESRRRRHELTTESRASEKLRLIRKSLQEEHNNGLDAEAGE